MIKPTDLEILQVISRDPNTIDGIVDGLRQEKGIPETLPRTINPIKILKAVFQDISFEYVLLFVSRMKREGYIELSPSPPSEKRQEPVYSLTSYCSDHLDAIISVQSNRRDIIR